jgi:16S rRNA G966 N2-methylase RsmD
MEARPFPLADATIVFADPPYDADLAADLWRHLAPASMPSLLTLVVEHRTRTVVEAPRGMVIERQRRFGDTTVTYFVPAPEV